MSSEIPSSKIVDAKIREALTNYPTKKDVEDAMKLKQNALTDSQTNAVDSGVTKELVTKLNKIEEGAQKNVPPVTPSPDGAGKAADAKAMYDALETKADKAKLHPCEVEVTDSTITITPTNQDTLSGGFYVDGAIRSEEERWYDWETDVLVLPIYISWMDYDTYEWFSESSTVTIDFNGKISVTEFNEGQRCVVTVEEDIPIMDISYFKTQVGHVPKYTSIEVYSYGNNLYYGSVNYYSFSLGSIGDKFIGFDIDSSGLIEMEFRRTPNIINPPRDVIFNFQNMGLSGNKFLDHTVNINSMNSGTVDVTWHGLSGVVEKFPGASRMLPGRNVWRVTRVWNGLTLIDRNTNSDVGVLTSPSGKTAVLVLNDDMSLEVKKV